MFKFFSFLSFFNICLSSSILAKDHFFTQEELRQLFHEADDLGATHMISYVEVLGRDREENVLYVFSKMELDREVVAMCGDNRIFYRKVFDLARAFEEN